MQQTEFDFYTKLIRNRRVPSSHAPKIVLRSSAFGALLESKVLIKEKQSGGAIYRVAKDEHFEAFYANAFPNPDIEVLNETDNQMKFKNTKATNIDKERVIFIRGAHSISINNEEIDISYHTREFGLFSSVLKSLRAEKICFVENLESFLKAEELLGDDYTYIHFYGRLPKEQTLRKIECSEYLHFGDYDYVGLSEFERASMVFPIASLYMPNDFDAIFKKYAKERKERDTAYKNVLQSTNKDVIRVRELLNTNLFLEQQVLFGSDL